MVSSATSLGPFVGSDMSHNSAYSSVLTNSSTSKVNCLTEEVLLDKHNRLKDIENDLFKKVPVESSE